jgi:hypothetical protein
MKALIGNQVKTDVSNYPFKSREEAEAFYFSLRDREVQKVAQPSVAPPPSQQDWSGMSARRTR